MQGEARLPALADQADSTQSGQQSSNSTWVTAGASAEQGDLSFWPWLARVNEAQLTVLDSLPFFPAPGTQRQTSCLKTRIGRSQQNWGRAGLWHHASWLWPSPRAGREASSHWPGLLGICLQCSTPLRDGVLENSKPEKGFKKTAAQTTTVFQNCFSFGFLQNALLLIFVFSPLSFPSQERTFGSLPHSKY